MKFFFTVITLFLGGGHLAASPITKITLKKGQTERVELPSNPTTGYSWYVSKELPRTSPIAIAKSGYQPPETKLVGSGGTQWWDIRGIKKGNCTFSLEYKRPWEKNVKPAQIKKIAISVR